MELLWIRKKNVKSFPSHKAHRAALISVSLALSQTPVYTARPRIQSALHGVPVYVPAFAGTHCAYVRRDGQAELTWVAGYIPRLFTRLLTVTDPSTNRARRWLTSLMRPTTLPTKPNRHYYVLSWIKSRNQDGTWIVWLTKRTWRCWRVAWCGWSSLSTDCRPSQVNTCICRPLRLCSHNLQRQFAHEFCNKLEATRDLRPQLRIVLPPSEHNRLSVYARSP